MAIVASEFPCVWEKRLARGINASGDGQRSQHCSRRVAVAVIKVDPQWLILYMNPAAAQALKVQRREVSGEHFWRTCKEFPADIVQQACSSSESYVRLEYQHEGRWKCIDIRTVEGGSRVIHITDRSEIHESRQQLRSEIEKRGRLKASWKQSRNSFRRSWITWRPALSLATKRAP